VASTEKIFLEKKWARKWKSLIWFIKTPLNLIRRWWSVASTVSANITGLLEAIVGGRRWMAMPHSESTSLSSKVSTTWSRPYSLVLVLLHAYTLSWECSCLYSCSTTSSSSSSSSAVGELGVALWRLCEYCIVLVFFLSPFRSPCLCVWSFPLCFLSFFETGERKRACTVSVLQACSGLPGFWACFTTCCVSPFSLFLR